MLARAALRLELAEPPLRILGALAHLVELLASAGQRLSGRVNPDSRIIYDRDPRTMVEKVAPWLTVDSDTYPAVVDGRLVWILDGYTTTSNYPMSELVDLSESTSDSLTAEDAVEYFLAGASAIQVGTANFYDPKAPLHVLTGLEKFLKKRGLSSTRDLVGQMKQ